MHKMSCDFSIPLNFNDIDLINLAREGVKKDSLKSLNNYLDNYFGAEGYSASRGSPQKGRQ
jgi:hypothetical protein